MKTGGIAPSPCEVSKHPAEGAEGGCWEPQLMIPESIFLAFCYHCCNDKLVVLNLDLNFLVFFFFSRPHQSFSS